MRVRVGVRIGVRVRVRDRVRVRVRDRVRVGGSVRPIARPTKPESATCRGDMGRYGEI